MLAQLLLAQQAPPIVQIREFRELPEWFIPLAASVIFLFIFRNYGEKFTPDGNRWLDIIMDLAVLLSAASIVATISTWPIIQSVIAVVQSWMEGGATQAVQVSGWEISSGVIALIVLIVIGLWYERSEGLPSLIAFGIIAQVAILFAPWLVEVFGFWINYPIWGVWWVLMFLLDLIPSISFTVS